MPAARPVRRGSGEERQDQREGYTARRHDGEINVKESSQVWPYRTSKLTHFFLSINQQRQNTVHYLHIGAELSVSQIPIAQQSSDAIPSCGH